jgi:hypothetical protein
MCSLPSSTNQVPLWSFGMYANLYVPLLVDLSTEALNCWSHGHRRLSFGGWCMTTEAPSCWCMTTETPNCWSHDHRRSMG